MELVCMHINLNRFKWMVQVDGLLSLSQVLPMAATVVIPSPKPW